MTGLAARTGTDTGRSLYKPRALSSRPPRLVISGLWLIPPGPRRTASGESAAAGGPGGTLCRVPGLPAVPEGGQEGQDPVGVHCPPDGPGPAPAGAECVRDPDQVGLRADPGVTQPGEWGARGGGEWGLHRIPLLPRAAASLSPTTKGPSMVRLCHRVLGRVEWVRSTAQGCVVAPGKQTF